MVKTVVMTFVHDVVYLGKISAVTNVYRVLCTRVHVAVASV